MSSLFLTIIVTFFAGMGAGLGTGFAGMSAAAVISPMLITFLGMDPYMAVGIALSSDVLASAISAYTYGKNKNLDIKNGLIMMVSVLIFTVVGSYVSSLVPSATMGSFSVFMTFLLGIKFIIRPVMTTKEAMEGVSAKKRAIQSVVCGVLIGFICGFIGAGGAGFAAALTAKALGVSVILLEKMPQVGGNSLISGAEMNVAQSWIQKELGIKDSPELHAQDTLKGGDYKGDPAVVETMTHGTLPAAEWLKNTVGIKYEPHNLFQFGGNSVKRALIPVGQTGTEYITKLSALAQKEKIPVVTGMKAVALVKNKDGRVVGVSCESNGKKYDFYAKGGIILATGGFGANAAMVKKYNPSLDERFKTTDAPGTTGEALYMAQKAGAELVNMQSIQTYPICDPISGVIELIADARFDGAILINQEGKRFVEELQRRDVISHAILNQPGSYCYVLWNDNIGKISNTVKAHPEEYETFTKQGVMHTADNLKEVADFFKIPYDNLKATVDRVSQMAKDGGKDLDFHNRGGLKDLSTGKYYIIKAVPSIHHTMGGVRINPKAEALDKNGKPVPGLYAAGEVTGCTHGTNRLGGNAYTDIMVFGRIAGQQAAQAAQAAK